MSPLGAIANGVELLTLSGAPRSPEFDLIVESVESASARLRFFRFAFGAGGVRTVRRADVTGTLEQLSRAGRLRFAWEAEGELTGDEVKALFLAIQCLEAAMPLGGRVRIDRVGGRWEVSADGHRLRPDLAAWSWLAGGDLVPEPESPTIQFLLLPPLLAAMGRPIALDLTRERLKIAF